MNRLAAILLLTVSALAENRVPNSGFELGMRRGWIYWPSDSYQESMTSAAITGMLTNDAYSGNWAFRMPFPGYLTSRPIWLAAGNYTASFWARSTVNMGSPSTFHWELSDISRLSMYHLTNEPSLTTAWMRYHAHTTISSNAFYYLQFNWGAANGAYPQIDCVQVESGSDLTDWAVEQPIEAGICATNVGHVFFAGDTKQMDLRWWNAAGPTQCKYALTFLDDYGRTISGSSNTVVVASGASTNAIALPPTNGWMRVLLRLNLPDSWDETAVSVVPFAAQIGDNTNSIIGIHTHATDYYLSKYRRLGFGWKRQLSIGIQSTGWKNIEPARDTWTWHDSEMTAIRDAALSPLATLTPATGSDGDWLSWATNLDGSPSLSDFTNYAGKLAERYGSLGTGQVKVIEMLNEPQGYDSSPWDTWYIEGNYAEMLGETANAIRAADPNMIIVGMGGVADVTWAHTVWDMLASEIQSKVEVLSTHRYLGGSVNPNSSDTTTYFRDWMNVFQGVRPVWYTESGIWGAGGLKGLNLMYPAIWSPYASYSPECLRSEKQDRCRMVIDNWLKTFLRAIGEGMAKSWYYDARFFYSYMLTVGTHCTLNEWDQTVRAQGIAMTTAANFALDNGTGLGRITNLASASIEGYLYKRSDGAAVLAVWSSDMAQRTLTTTNAAFGQFDHWGNILATNTTTAEVNRTPRYWLASSMDTNDLRTLLVTASSSTVTDVTAPCVTVDIAPTGSWTNGQLGLVKWSAQDNRLVNWSTAPTNIVYSWAFDSDSFSPYSASNHTWIGTLTEGNHRLTVRARDAAGNIGTTEYWFEPGYAVPPPPGTIKVGNATVGALTVP